MKVSLNWLRDYVPLSLSIPELIERLTIAGLEVASIRLFGIEKPTGLRTKIDEPGPVWDKEKIVTAQVLGVEKHPNADKLKLVQLDYGTGTPKQVVTAAPNISVGDKGPKVILGLSGCTYFDGHVSPKQIKELKPSSLRGVPSDAMVMSNYELGITEEHEGIIILEPDAPIGKPLVDFMGDGVLEIDVLPNMARCLAMINIAREISALTGQAICIPEPKPQFAKEPVEGKVKVEIVDAKLCGRYSAMIIRNVTIGPAPGWMQRRLIYSGIRAISNIVDITNYVMLEYGQPLHAFDYDVLVKRAGGKSPTIIVRPAKDGEVLKTLDGVDRKLSPENLVIADNAGAIALAGVMGGAETEVTSTSKNILLEAATFDYVSIRRTARQFNLFSEASTRFSRGIHTEVVKGAAFRAAELLQNHAGGEVLQGIVDNYPAPTPTKQILLQSSEIKRILGIDLAPEDVEKILTALHFQLERQEQGCWKVTPPPFRTDLQVGSSDLIEEIARIYGYDRLPGTLLSGELPPQRNNSRLRNEETARDLLSTLGMQEVITYSLTSKREEAKLDPDLWHRLQNVPEGVSAEKHEQSLLPDGNYVVLKNPIAPERSVMRKTFISNLLSVALFNLRNTPTVRLFEVGSIYLPKKGDRLPQEPRRLSLVLAGHRLMTAWDDVQGSAPKICDFYDLKGIIDLLLSGLHLGNVTYRNSKEIPYLHPAKAAEILVNGTSIGHFGELHPKCVIAFDLAEKTVLVGDLDLERILGLIPERFAYQPISTFPPALRDIAIVVDESVTNEKVVSEISVAGGNLLKKVSLFDLYRGEAIPEGKKSLAYALTYQSNEGTLSDKDIEKAHKKVEDRLKHVLNAKIRGKD